MTPQDHNKALGISHLAYGGFHLLLLALGSIFFLFILAVPHRGGEEVGVFMSFMLILMAFGMLFTLPSLIAGYALLKRKDWARTAAIVAGILAMPSFPYGTALGVYTLWFMFDNAGKDLYANLSAWSDQQQSALPGARVAGDWARGAAKKEREREYVPPPRMPDWR